MDVFTITDSSDDESCNSNKSFELPIIVHVESTSKNENADYQKNGIIKKIGDCTLTLRKHRTSDVIEIIEDSDDESKYNNSLQKTIESNDRLFVTSSIETNHQNVSCSVNARVPLLSLKSNNDIQTTKINISVTPNIRKSNNLVIGNSKLLIRNITTKKLEENIISLIEDSDSDTEPISRRENIASVKDKPNSVEVSTINSVVKVKTETIKENADLRTEKSNSINEAAIHRNDEAFKNFLQACKEVENSDRMNLIIEKIQKYHNNAHSDYIKSNSFYDLIQRSIESIINSKNYYLYIKDFIEELRARKVTVKPESTTSATECDDENRLDPISKNKEEKIHRLESALRKIIKILKNLEEKEVDFDDEYDSTYLLQDRYERRMIKIYNKLCEITGEQPSAGRAIKRKIYVAISTHQSINKAVQDFVNKKKEFPDYQDILKIVKSSNELESLKMSNAAEALEARKVFEHIGSELQRRRQADYYLSISDYLQSETDPAEKDPSLKNKLKKNHDENKHKIPEIINKYVEKAESIGLKEEEVDSDQAKSDDEKESEAEESDGSSTNII
ncbi:death domain-associated protein 6-like [Ctenocephalides felis]|uniref:death domain-associated protein 6-like n=1 Tax=Ctenocephalides felis TaxID=7515 RepID=UPI000E6E11AE|nr:death domain-associated protein 6-like [Ctenocephalides felis]